MASTPKHTVEQEVCADLIGLIRKLQTDRQSLEARYQGVMVKLQKASSESAVLREQSVQTRSRSEEINLAILELRGRLGLKQAAIRTLLPFYPHPISSELRYQIDC